MGRESRFMSQGWGLEQVEIFLQCGPMTSKVGSQGSRRGADETQDRQVSRSIPRLLRTSVRIKRQNRGDVELITRPKFQQLGWR
jgi:hypothetical protein